MKWLMKGSSANQYLSVWAKLKSIRLTGKLAAGRLVFAVMATPGFSGRDGAAILVIGRGLACEDVPGDADNL
jgi:hypothetical protein